MRNGLLLLIGFVAGVLATAVVAIKLYGPKLITEPKVITDFAELYPDGVPFTGILKRVEESTDPRTGFKVGGVNSTELIQTLTEINGRRIADLEKNMRPGEHSPDVYLGPDESLLGVLADDNAYVVDKLGLTHQELAKQLKTLFGIHLRLRHEKGFSGAPFVLPRQGILRTHRRYILGELRIAV